MPVASVSRSAVLALGLALVGLLACAVSAVGLLRSPAATPTAPAAFSGSLAAATAPVVAAAPGAPGATGAPRATDVREASAALRSWDAARGQAWARGDPAALARLYAPGSAAGAHDVAMLRAWRARGLVVEGLATQLLAVEPVTSRPARGWTLRVTDRVVGGEAVAHDGTRTRLPVDEASTRRVTLRRHAGRWVVASVAPVGGGA